MKAHITQFFCFILFLFTSIGAQADEFLYRQLSISDGFPPYIQHIYADDNGFVCDTVDDFVSAITSAKGKALAEKAYEDFMSKYETKAQAKRYADIYRGLKERA